MHGKDSVIIMNTVVIGATQGLGLELTKKLLMEGHCVAAGVVERDVPAALAELLRSYGNKLLVFKADVTNEEEILCGAKQCVDFMGNIHALCNVAGVLLKGDRTNTIDVCDISELRKTMEVNALGPIIVAKSFYPYMEDGGKIFTITSEGVGVKSCGTWVPCYALSKTAATKVSGMFNEAVSRVDFFAVHPGRMNTEMGKTTAQIEPEESAAGIYRLMAGQQETSRAEWYINYKGEPMEA